MRWSDMVVVMGSEKQLGQARRTWRSRCAWWLTVGLIVAVAVVTVAGLISGGGAPDPWWRMYLAPVRMVTDLVGGGR